MRRLSAHSAGLLVLLPDYQQQYNGCNDDAQQPQPVLLQEAFFSHDWLGCGNNRSRGGFCCRWFSLYYRRRCRRGCRGSHGSRLYCLGRGGFGYFLLFGFFDGRFGGGGSCDYCRGGRSLFCNGCLSGGCSGAGAAGCSAATGAGAAATSCLGWLAQADNSSTARSRAAVGRA